MAMLLHFNMDPAEFIEGLRYGAIASGAPPQLIDNIDALHSLVDMESAVKEAENNAESAANARDDLWKEMVDLLKALPVPHAKDKALRRALKAACDTLERHSEEEFQRKLVAQLRDGLEPLK